MIAAEKNGHPVMASKFWEEAERRRQDKDQWLRANRTGFICAVCRAKASFVSPGGGRKGTNPPHFRVPGDNQCNNHKPSGPAERPEGNSARESEGIINVGGIVTVRYDTLGGVGGGGAALPGAGGANPGGDGGGGRIVSGGGPPIDRESAGLKSFLSDLQSMPLFPPSTLRLRVQGRGEVWGKDYFCRFEEITAEHTTPLLGEQESRLMAYWGEVQWVNPDTNAVFINGKDSLTGSIIGLRLESKHKPALLAALDIDDFKDANGKGWYVIAEGRLAENSYKNGFHLKLSDTSRIGFIKPKP